MARWGMTIDLLRCVACYACQISCKQKNFLPPGIFFNRLVVGETGKYPMVRKHIYPVMCNHCEEAPCVKVCPTGASYRRQDGIITIDDNHCMGCQYCIIACPYQQRTSYQFRESYPGQGKTQYEIFGEQYCPHKTKTAVKCDFCMDRLDSGLKKGLKPGIDWDATPVCVNACPTKARTFGDLDDGMSNIIKLIRERQGFQLHPEFDTQPSIYYLV